MFARVPSAAWICALVALLNGAAWSLITPPFEGRDEPDHFAYVQTLAENGTLPGPAREYSPAEQQALLALHQPKIELSPQSPAISAGRQQRALTQTLHAGYSRVGPGQAGVAASEPPLYYALELLPYEVAPGNILVQLELMRLVSALLGALTALLIVLFLREALPAVPWAATGGGLCAAMFPLFGFMSGTLNPDDMLNAVSAAAFLSLARAFRHGLTPRRAAAIGLVVVVGLITKINFLGLLPGIAVGVLVLAVRQMRKGSWRELKVLGIAAGIGGAPVALYVLANVLSGDPPLGFVSGAAPAATTSISNELSYVWQFYLPRLPGMPMYFSGLSTFRDVWFDRLVGLYGWVDTMFPPWVNNVALVPAAAIAALCLRQLIALRRVLGSRFWELATYAVMGIGILALVGATSYAGDAVSHTEAYVDPRYLLPMLALFAAALTLAIRGAGRRFGPLVMVAIVALFFAHDLFSQLQVIARYYG